MQLECRLQQPVNFKVFLCEFARLAGRRIDATLEHASRYYVGRSAQECAFRSSAEVDDYIERVIRPLPLALPAQPSTLTESPLAGVASKARPGTLSTPIASPEVMGRMEAMARELAEAQKRVKEQAEMIRVLKSEQQHGSGNDRGEAGASASTGKTRSRSREDWSAQRSQRGESARWRQRSVTHVTGSKAPVQHQKVPPVLCRLPTPHRLFSPRHRHSFAPASTERPGSS